MRNFSSAFISLILATRLRPNHTIELIASLHDPVSPSDPKRDNKRKIRPRHNVTNLTPAEKNTNKATKVDLGSDLNELAKGGASSRG